MTESQGQTEAIQGHRQGQFDGGQSQDQDIILKDLTKR